MAGIFQWPFPQISGLGDLTLTSDDLGRHIVMNYKSASTNITNWFVAALRFIVNVSTYVRKNGQTFLHMLLGSSQKAKMI